MISIGFICVHNSCRSQMAEGWAKYASQGRFAIYSAGSEQYHEVKPLAVQVMQECGIDMSCHYPKLLTDIPATLDIVITMGCNVECPHIGARYRTDWGLTDPSGGPIEDFRVTRDLIKEKVESLLKAIDEGLLFQDA